MSVVGTVTGYKSLDLSGYAHHVLAVRGSGGWADTKAGSYYEVGGTSGGLYNLFPGYTVGEGRQTFPVRGFPPATLIGIRALSGSAEYRAPLSLAHRTIGLVPAFLNRTSLTFFGDYGVAFDPAQQNRLRAVFPGGVCDYRRPSVGFGPSRPWVNYGSTP